MFSWNHKPHLRRAQNSDFHAGETWAYQTRPHETGSTFFVLRVETLPDNSNVVHIQLNGLKIPNPASPDGLSDSAEHLPVSETALAASATHKISSADAPPMPAGYAQWRAEWEAGRAGAFQIPLAEIADVLEEAMNKLAS